MLLPGMVSPMTKTTKVPNPWLRRKEIIISMLTPYPKIKSVRMAGWAASKDRVSHPF